MIIHLQILLSKRIRSFLKLGFKNFVLIRFSIFLAIEKWENNYEH